MRLVLDTNTAVSGLIWQGTPGRIIDAGLAEKVRLLSSVPLLAELEGVLQRPKFQQTLQRRGVKVSDLFDGYAALVGCVAPVELVEPRSPLVDEQDPLAFVAFVVGKPQTHKRSRLMVDGAMAGGAVPIRKVVRSGCLNCAPLSSLHQFVP